MTTVTTGARYEQLTEEEKASLRCAMLSVYYQSLGRQLESRGAPVMAVPPEVRPLSLEEALERLEPWEFRLWDAYWRIVRAVPVEGWRGRPLESRYPSALLERLGAKEVEKLDERRRRSRAGAQLFAAALQACAEERWPEAEALADLLKKQTRNGFVAAREFNTTTKSVLGLTADELLKELADKQRRARTALELRSLEEEVGLNLYDFVEDFADVVAFADFRSKHFEDAMTMLTSSCIVRQDTISLTTTATVTALVETDFENLARVIDPLSWPDNSDVIDKTYYVADPFDPDSKIPRGRRRGKSFGNTRFLFEDVGLKWGTDDVQDGRFRNVLAIDKFSVREDLRSITLPFRLCRSIDSRILWDDRAGGLVIDGGYIKARELVPGHWRVTSRKVLRFSDRTPYSNAPGWRDFGQLINYLAPAAVTWWLETELHSTDPARPRILQDQDQKGEADGE